MASVGEALEGSVGRIAIYLQQPSAIFLLAGRFTKPGLTERENNGLYIRDCKRNLNLVAEMQERNEAAAKVMLDYAVAARQQNVATASEMLKLVAAQGTAVTEAAKVHEKAMEDAMRESREAVIQTAEKIARNKKNS